MRIQDLRKLLLAAVAAATVVLSVGVPVSAAADPGTPELPQLVDQFGAPVTLDRDAGEIQIAIVVSAKRLRRIKAWEKALRKEFPDLTVVRVADVPRSSPTDYEKVAEKLRKRLPEDVPVGIDLAGEWASALDLDTSVPNVLVFDQAGELAYRQSGMYKKSLYPPLQSAISDAS
ncbi:MAG: TlpA family protein disulfide reductase [Gammaproteobacteria bacterium]